MPLVTPGADALRARRDVLCAGAPAVARGSVSAPDARRPAGDRAVHREHARQARGGIADNVLTEAALAHRGPILVAPAMNPRMWSHAATRANAELLLARGVELIGPDEGELAEGEWGVGRLAEPEEIAARDRAAARTPGSLTGRRVIVTAGGTREPIDSVRFLGNRSSGRMGVALAEEARRRGADVVLLAANLQVPAPYGVEVLPDADGRGDARRGARARRLRRRPARGRRRRLSARSRRSTASGRRTTRRGRSSSRRPSTSPARSASGRRRARCSSRSAPTTARRGSSASAACSRRSTPISSSSTTSGATGIGFDAAENEVVLVTAGGERTVERAAKRKIAAAILDAVEELLGARAEASTV